MRFKRMGNKTALFMKKKLNVAIVAACPFPSQRGTPIRIFRTAEAIGRRGHNVHVVGYHFGDGSDSDAFCIHRIPDIKYYRNFSAGPTYPKLLLLDFLLAIKLYKVLKAYNIDLIHAHHYEGLLASLLAHRITGHPLIYDAHTILESELPFYSMSLPNSVKRIIGRWIDKQIPKQADQIIAVTEEIKQSLIRKSGVNPACVTVVVNGVERQAFLNIPDTPSIPDDGIKRIVYTGNLSEFQGVDFLLHSFKEMLKQRHDIRLCIVSIFPFDRFESMARKLGIRDKIDVVCAGFDEVPRYLAQADVAVNPRVVCDGLPQKILNYMAAGKPIVSFAGSAKLIEHGKTGWIVENGSVEAFSEGVIRLLQDRDLAASLGSNARRFVMSEYTWDRAAEKMETIYYDLLEQRKKSL
jgi:glycosyltransferase involved in cell wall biosynthesis